MNREQNDNMVSISFLNPLSSEGKDIVRKLGNFEGISQAISELKDIIENTPRQDFDDMPSNYIELALKRIEWHVKKKNPEFNKKEYAFLFNPKITKYDVISFYLLCQAIGVRFGPNSREARVMVECQGDIINERLEKLQDGEKKSTIDENLPILMHHDKLHWTFFADLLSSRKLFLTELVLDKGELILDLYDFTERFGSLIKNKKPEHVYDFLIGNQNLKEKIIVKMIMQETEDYIKQVHEKARIMVEPNPILLELADEVAEVLSEPMQSYGYGSGSGGGAPMKIGPLNPLAFPPCVKKAMEGIKSGGRNDAIVLFMTPFISYARLYPDVFRMNITKRVSDQDPNLEIVEKEILPLIYEAAQNCVPPLFDDQPQEKVNINAKLGFGMHSSLKMEHEGETIWYTPMSCEKIKLHLPHLCKQDDVCKNIGNPLSYYNRMIWEVRRQEKESSGDGQGSSNKGNENSVDGTVKKDSESVNDNQSDDDKQGET